MFYQENRHNLENLVMIFPSEIFSLDSVSSEKHCDNYLC